MAINEFAIGETMPDLTVFFDIAPEEGLARIAANDEREENRLDNESINFHRNVYEGYQELIRRYPARIQVTDASLPKEQVTENVWKISMRTTHLIRHIHDIIVRKRMKRGDYREIDCGSCTGSG